MSNDEIRRQLADYWSSLAEDLPAVSEGAVPGQLEQVPTTESRWAMVGAVGVGIAAIMLLAFVGLARDPVAPAADDDGLVLPIDRVPGVVFDGASCEYYGPMTFPVGGDRVFTLVNSSDERIRVEIYETSPAMTEDLYGRVAMPWPREGFFYQSTLSVGETAELDATLPEGRDGEGRWVIFCFDSDRDDSFGTLFDVVEP